MADLFAAPFDEGTVATIIPILAARCWRAARDSGHPVQPCLTATFCPHDCEMLAPCLDSLLSFVEQALGRPFDAADGDSSSADEHLLLDLLVGERSTRACLACGEGVVRALECALCSARIMLALEHSGLPEHTSLR